MYRHNFHPSYLQIKFNLTTPGILLALVTLAWAPLAWSLPSDREQTIEVDSEFGNLDVSSGFSHLWGNVNIVQGTLKVKADDANIYIENGKVTRVVLTGAPATWQQTLEGNKVMRARGGEIEYKVDESVILLSENAQVDHPQGTINGDLLTYNLNTEKLQADTKTGGGRVRMRLEPDLVDRKPAAETSEDNESGSDIGTGAASDDVPVETQSTETANDEADES